MSSPKQVGLRMDNQSREAVSTLAVEQNRSISNLLNIMIVEQLKRADKGGWNAIYQENDKG